LLSGARAQGKFGEGAQRAEGFAAEAERADPLQVVKGPQLGRAVLLGCGFKDDDEVSMHQRTTHHASARPGTYEGVVGRIDAVTVVAHLHGRLAAVTQANL
jgi:hypothetical protein